MKSYYLYAVSPFFQSLLFVFCWAMFELVYVVRTFLFFFRVCCLTMFEGDNQDATRIYFKFDSSWSCSSIVFCNASLDALEVATAIIVWRRLMFSRAFVICSVRLLLTVGCCTAVGTCATAGSVLAVLLGRTLLIVLAQTGKSGSLASRFVVSRRWDRT